MATAGGIVATTTVRTIGNELSARKSLTTGLKSRMAQLGMATLFSFQGNTEGLEKQAPHMVK